MTMKVNIANKKKKKILGGARQPDTTYISLTMKEKLIISDHCDKRILRNVAKAVQLEFIEDQLTLKPIHQLMS